MQTLSPAINFIAAMAMYPEVQKKAQEEIDRVVGKNRLPDFSDQDSLPYVNAVVKESLRWKLVVPTGASLVSRKYFCSSPI